MRVSELAMRLNTTADTVRYYARIGLIEPRKNKINGYKEFSMMDLNRLKFILLARQLGFSVTDIEKILIEADKGQTPCPTAKKLIEERLIETEKQFQDVLQLRNRMKEAIKRWKNEPYRNPEGSSICHLIESFNEEFE
jgi:DNA-binding transcriptional MerR regulator